MTNQERIAANNAELDKCISKANALPEAGGIDTSDATATADEIFAGETAYGTEGKVTGTFTIDEELTTQDDLISQIATALQNKAAVSEIALQNKTVTPTKSIQTIQADSGYDGLELVTVNAIPNEYIIPSGTLNITENGTYNITDKASVTVKVAGSGGTADTSFKDYIEGTLTEIDDDSITTIRTRAFDSMLSIEIVNLPNATSIGSYAFNGCKGLVSVNLPSLNAAISTYSFTGCSALKQVNAPNATAANNYSFQDTTALEKLDLLGTGTFGSYSFRRSGITALIIRNNTSKLSKLSATNAFTDCPIANGTGYIYFYREYVETYKAATGWSAYADQIRAIEDYPEICG